MMLFYSRCNNKLKYMKADIYNFIQDIKKKEKKAKTVYLLM